MTVGVIDFELLSELHRRVCLGIDAIGILEVVATWVPQQNTRNVLEALVDDDTCELEIPANVRHPLRSILDHFGLLEGILRHVPTA